jgi:hypothetical protein
MKTAIEVVWEEPPTLDGYGSKFDNVVNALLENPGRWLRLPEPSKNSNTGLRQLVRRRELPIQITTRMRSDGMFDIYAVCTTGIATTALPGVPNEEGDNA